MIRESQEANKIFCGKMSRFSINSRSGHVGTHKYKLAQELQYLTQVFRPSQVKMVSSTQILHTQQSPENVFLPIDTLWQYVAASEITWKSSGPQAGDIHFLLGMSKFSAAALEIQVHFFQSLLSNNCFRPQHLEAAERHVIKPFFTCCLKWARYQSCISLRASDFITLLERN